jgi:NADP-dependent 3-hydroxy acid dehydrogenase YdfG
VFFIQGKAGSAFPIDTLLQLSDIYEFSGSEFLKGHMFEKVIEHKTTLQNETVAQIINCVKKLKEDISVKHFTLIMSKTV